ncbi:hypothetical protein WN55_09426 [Dufourea novaeangliae]|uniref:Uncharacterized protein n=1 Tax=Dufourea novaeangliae TaxID=178035 RepID=A0A154P7X1_DUFNO|nr:hypothetical protein WN55_09426 [Dufourea novaeangliae]
MEDVRTSLRPGYNKDCSTLRIHCRDPRCTVYCDIYRGKKNFKIPLLYYLVTLLRRMRLPSSQMSTD